MIIQKSNERKRDFALRALSTRVLGFLLIPLIMFVMIKLIEVIQFVQTSTTPQKIIYVLLVIAISIGAMPFVVKRNKRKRQEEYKNSIKLFHEVQGDKFAYDYIKRLAEKNKINIEQGRNLQSIVLALELAKIGNTEK